MNLFEKSNNVSSNLTLTNNLYDLRYRSDGSGRDHYITHNNGGMMSHSQAKVKKSDYLSGGRFIPTKPQYSGLGEIAMPVHYRSNGSGRDHYITATDGGLSHPSRPCDPRVTFKRHLREYSRIDNYQRGRNYKLAGLNSVGV